MARPKKDKAAESRSLRMTPEDWAALEEKAKLLGFRGRAELLRAVARGQVAPSTEDRRAILLGELVAG